jgi:transcription-repair coupling factor (superfamily II helicase)
MAYDAKQIAKASGSLTLAGAPEGFDALVMADIARARGGLTAFVARDTARASAFIDALKFFAPEIEAVLFPSWDCLPYDRIGPSAGVAATRMATLHRLAEGLGKDKPAMLVTAAPALLQRVPEKAVLLRASYSAKVGNVVDVKDLERYFAINGYSRASTVSERGEFAIRGGVIDVYPAGRRGAGAPGPVRRHPGKHPRLRSGDPALDQAAARDPAAAGQRGPARQGRHLAVPQRLYPRVRRAGRRSAVRHDQRGRPPRRPGALAAAVLRADGDLFDYLPDGALIGVDHQVTESRDERLAMIADAYDARASADRKSAYRPLAPDALYLTAKEWDAAVEDRPNRKFTPFQPQGLDVVDMGAKLGRTFAAERAQDSVNLFEATADHARKLAGEGKRVLFASWSEGSSERLGTMLADHGLKKIPYAAYWQAAKANDPKTPQRVVLPLDNGFETETLAVISETDILGDRLARPRKKRRAANFLAEASALTPGDLVVHIDHGIGRYEGLKTLDVQGAPHDCLDLLYGGEAKLYLPVENIDLLTRYGTDAENVQLDKLGGAAWQGRKAKAKERLRVMAEGLIQIAAARQLKSVEETDPPHGVFDEFCARFPYEETDDQLSAIHDVLEDLSSGKPMDRLICGDVGFGKTEVALRAAFVVAMSGKQVAIVCPTTLLARQHYKTFKDRFQGWPVKVTRLSRLVTGKEASETRDGLANGQFEIVVGTHAILSKQVSFKDLGLVIVDEEQHFGVKHKEKLKELRADVHMLTLTATPIPRTLQMALSGIREMSIIATPPVDRLAVRTYISPFDPSPCARPCCARSIAAARPITWCRASRTWRTSRSSSAPRCRRSSTWSAMARWPRPSSKT